MAQLDPETLARLRKPAYGTGKLARNGTRTKRTTRGKDIKAQAKYRDGRRCRFPRCQMQRQGFPLDGAHLKAAGMGGNPDESRMTLENIISVCRWHHRGAVSMHSGDIKAVPRFPQLGANSLVDWYITDAQKQWTWVDCTGPVRQNRELSA